MKLTLLMTFISSIILAQTICHSVYRPNIGRSQSNNLEIMAQLNRVDDSIALLNRQLRKDDEFKPTFLQGKIEKDFDKIEKALLRGDYLTPGTQMRSLYAKVEYSYLRVLQFNRLSRVLREAHQIGVVKLEPLLKQNEVVSYLRELYAPRISSLDDIARALREIEDEIARDVRILGKNFQRYDYYRSELAALKKANYCSQKCLDAIKELNKSMGVMTNARRSAVNEFIGVEKSITLNKVRNLYNSLPESQLIQRKKELLFEGVGLLKRFVNKFGLLRNLMNYLANNVSPQSRRLYRMLRSVFDERYLANHSKGIERIVNSELGGTQKYNLMKNEVKKLDEKMFWVDLSRTRNNSAKRAWQEIKDEAKAKNLTDELAQMEDAQKIGEILGSPRNRNIRNTIRIVTTLALVGGATAYFSFDTDEDDSNGNGDGQDIDLSNGQDIDLSNGDETQTDNGSNTDVDAGDDDSGTTVLIDYLSPEDQEIEQLMIDLIEVSDQLETTSEKDASRP